MEYRYHPHSKLSGVGCKFRKISAAQLLRYKFGLLKTAMVAKRKGIKLFDLHERRTHELVARDELEEAGEFISLARTSFYNTFFYTIAFHIRTLQVHVQ